ncbi:very-long-chain enoyl-CoA reductase-like isoform X2 [Biomphalaria glabrata]|uniref:very-long-chain enoyl-CoA reductase n=1 Tax=Biomphalaria glabrata TaxID=6526 RepID=A0A9U8EM34_BIOGL|nr:very-long-chain enoyl-CoA reductase-like isoform X1 [Biomphalaria glabrata]XP_055886846.1 very-long-chain enoyl-CoA reductase-like isoform X2 [Biomphalaria glabrata]
MEVNICHATSGKALATIGGLSPKSTVLDIKNEFSKIEPKYYPDRQAFRLEPRGKILKEVETLEALNIKHHGKLFFKDLGPQVGWTTVFLTEYAGPLVIYLIFYTRPSFIYGDGASSQPYADVVNIAAGCWTFHYAKRLLETLFVHRFSHATMPILNIFKNSTYYWGFTALVAYFVNHPLYTPPTNGNAQIWAGLGTFIFAELGNFSVHVALRNLRPPGTKERRIPKADSNPFSWLFNLVSCPNYFYEVLAWVGFTVMTQCLPAGLFCLAGFYQMAVWAKAKHRNYLKEFKDYPRSRTAIVPFLL